MRKRRKPGSESASSERWLLTYADMITLLMIFFIMMYAISNVDKQKFQMLANVFGSALGSGTTMLDGGTAILPDQNNNLDAVNENIAQLSQLKKEIEQKIAEGGLIGKVTVKMEERGLVVRLQSTILFVSGSADLTPEARNIITSVGAMLKPAPNYVRIEGHTDNAPIRNFRFPSNWELSALRATNVVQVLVSENGIAPGRLSATGYGEYRPIAPNDSDDHRQMNRRVDILILSGTFNPVEPQV